MLWKPNLKDRRKYATIPFNEKHEIHFAKKNGGEPPKNI